MCEGESIQTMLILLPKWVKVLAHLHFYNENQNIARISAKTKISYTQVRNVCLELSKKDQLTIEKHGREQIIILKNKALAKLCCQIKQHHIEITKIQQLHELEDHELKDLEEI